MTLHSGSPTHSPGATLDAAFQPHQQRVVDERIDLDVKIHALDKFITTNPIFDTVGQAEQTRMQLQLMAMRLYSHILTDRIRAFPVKEA